jgi:peptidylprolyl isomerase
MIAGFDKGVEGMKVGETKTVTIAAKDAYGEWDKNKLISMPKDQVPNADQYQPGMQIMTQYGQTFKVYQVNDKDIIFDANHELAGKTLLFDITVKSVQK